MGARLCDVRVATLASRVLIDEGMGFEYARAVQDLKSKGWSYEKIAEQVGYKNKASIAAIVQGRQPRHRQGEALFYLYFEEFGCKPPNVYERKHMTST